MSNNHNHNLELRLGDDGVMYLNRWGANTDRFFQIRPDEQNAGKWVAYEQRYNPSDFDEPELIQVDLLSELSKMATAWRAEAKKEMDEFMAERRRIYDG